MLRGVPFSTGHIAGDEAMLRITAQRGDLQEAGLLGCFGPVSASIGLPSTVNSFERSAQ